MPSSRVIKRGSSSYVPYNWQVDSEREPAVASKTGIGRNESGSQGDSREALRQAHQRGYQEGGAAATAAQDQTLTAASAELATTVAELSLLRTKIFRTAQADLLHLSMAIARRILHREILVAPDVLGGIISVVIESLTGQEIYRVRVHPSMVQRVEKQLAGHSRHRGSQVLADASLPLGGCVFETGRGNVDASIESQLSEIEHGLADRLEQEE